MSKDPSVAFEIKVPNPARQLVAKVRLLFPKGGKIVVMCEWPQWITPNNEQMDYLNARVESWLNEHGHGPTNIARSCWDATLGNAEQEIKQFLERGRE